MKKEKAVNKNTNTSNNRNGIIEIWRFIACLSIAIFHYEWVYVGHPIHFSHFYIFVEFYFIISGFFLALKASDDKNDTEGFTYVVSQIKKLYPLYLLAFATIFVFKNLSTAGVTNWLVNLWNAKWEVLLFSTFNFGAGITYNMGGAPEFISSLLISTFLLFYIIKTKKELFKNIIAPLVIVCGLGYMINTYGNLSQWGTYNLFISSGFIRAFVDMSVGAWFALTILPIVCRLRDYKIIIMRILFILCYVALVFYAKYISYSDLIFYVFLFALMICVFYRSKTNKIFNTIFVYLGKISYPVFLFHYIVLYAMKYFNITLGYYQGIICFVIIVLLISTIVTIIEKNIRKLIKRYL